MPDVVGLALQGRSIRGVEARLARNGRCTVVRTGSIDIPETTIEDGALNDPEILAECIRQLWVDAGFKTKRVRIGIDGRTAVVRRTELPSPNETKLRQAASYDIAELLSYPISEAVFDVDEIERFDRDGATWARALVVAVRASALAELGSIAKQAGLRLAGTDLVAEALARSIQLSETPAAASGNRSPSLEGDGAGPVAIVDCEDSLTNVVIRDHTGVLFARTLNAGVGETAISVAEELESALAQLGGDDSTNTPMPSDAAIGVSTVVEGVRRTLSYYTTELDRRPIQNVTVVGGRGEAAGLLAALESTLAVPAANASPSVDWAATAPFLGFELALGVALGSARKLRTRHLVLTSDHDRAAQAKRNQRVAGIAMALPLAVGLGVTSTGLVDRTQDLENQAQLAEETADVLAMRITEFEDTRFRIDEWASAVSDIQVLDEQRLRLRCTVDHSESRSTSWPLFPTLPV